MFALPLLIKSGPRSQGPPRNRLGILLSGRGSNFLAIAQSIRNQTLPNTEIAVVLSNQPNAPGLAAARDLNLPAIAVPSLALGARPTPEARLAHDLELITHLRAHQVTLVCLAGYMRVLTPTFIQAFPNAILNIHPSLLPSFPGLHVQQQAIDFGARISGCTVHFVDERIDHGVIILQRPVPIEDTDTPDTLAARILTQEHLAYPEAIARVLSGQYEIQGRRYILKNSPKTAPPNPETPR